MLLATGYIAFHRGCKKLTIVMSYQVIVVPWLRAMLKINSV